MIAKPDAYSLPVLIPGFTVEFDGAPVGTKFGEYHFTLSGVVTETETGRRWRCHMWADRAGFPLRDGVQLNYLGKRAGAPVQPNHIPNAWAIVRAAWNDICISIRDAMADADEDRETMSRPERLALRRAEDANAEGIKADVRRRVDSFVPVLRHDPAATMEGAIASTIPGNPVRIKLEGRKAETVRRDNVEYHEGQAARRAGVPISKCPYDFEGTRGERWTLGWRETDAAESPSEAVSAMLDTAETIDMTPTWAAVLPIYIACLEDGTEAGKRAAREELARMAAAADRWNALAKDMKGVAA